MTSIRAAWRRGRDLLADSSSPALDARLLLGHALGRDHAYLVAHDDELLSPDSLSAYDALLGRAAAGEPIPYLLGHAPFMGLEFVVSPAVLIPRPETEQLVELALEWGRGRGPLRMADVGTGSGCIPISLAARMNGTFVAVDISAAALAVAAANVARHVPGLVLLARGDMLAALAPGLDLITANLPYVAADEWPTLPVGVKSYEPALALDGGRDGLDLIQALLPQAAARLRPGGLLLLEVGWRQGQTVADLARASFPTATVTVRPDFAGHDRIVAVERRGG